jgi:hypothetical protein
MSRIAIINSDKVRVALHGYPTTPRREVLHVLMSVNSKVQAKGEENSLSLYIWGLFSNFISRNAVRNARNHAQLFEADDSA